MDSDLKAYIEKRLGKVKYGEVQFTVKRYDNKNVSAISYESHSYKPTKQANDIDTAEYIIKAIKGYRDTEHKGTVSFSVTFNAGEITRVVMNVVEQENIE